MSSKRKQSSPALSQKSAKVSKAEPKVEVEVNLWSNTKASASEVAQFGLNQTEIERMLDELGSHRSEIKEAISTVGYPRSRQKDSNFTSLLRIMLGQQLSTKAASSISTKLDTLIVEHSGQSMDVLNENDTELPKLILSLNEEKLRSCGLSGQKVKYAHCLSTAVLNKDLELNKLSTLSDEEVIQKITAVKGYGRWSAMMFLMFSLGRTDVWPSGDLGVRAGLGKLMKPSRDLRKMEKEVEQLGDSYKPHRSSVALLCWHYLSNTPVSK